MDSKKVSKKKAREMAFTWLKKQKGFPEKVFPKIKRRCRDYHLVEVGCGIGDKKDQFKFITKIEVYDDGSVVVKKDRRGNTEYIKSLRQRD